MKNLKFKYVVKSKKLAVLVMAVAISTSFSFTKANAAALTDRYSGINRYETAAKVCEDGWKTNSDYAVIVNGENFPDSLSAAPLAKKYDAPILLTGADTLSPYTSSELNRLNVENVIIIGGRGVVHQTIEDALKARGIKVTRIGGADRYETALQVAAKLGKSTEIALVNGSNFHDGISIASIAAMKGMPIILTNKDSMPASVKKYLQSNKKADQIYVVGGTDRISDSDISGLTNVKRIGSGDDYEMNTSIIEAFENEMNTGTIYIASAKDFPDSLGASAIAPKTSSPVLFVDSPMSESTKEFLKNNIVNNIKVLGGAGAVSYEAEQISGSLPLNVAQTSNLSDTIWQNEKYSPRKTMVITASDGNKKEVAVDWNLTKINTTKPGIYTFTGTIKGTDKTVYNTLIVKPLTYKIDDITKTANSRENFELPSTVLAQMTDGTKSQVAVNWDYGTQSGNKPGVYIFNGTVDKYSKKVKLTLTINPASTIASIQDFKKVFDKDQDKQDMYDYINSSMPSKVTALMDDGSSNTFSITWDSVSKLVKGTAKGTYILKGTVPGYGSKVNYLMVLQSEGGVDPNPSDSGNGGNGGDNSGTIATDLGELAPIMQGDPYPSTVTDPTTKKQVQVTWNNAVSIDTSSNITDSTDQNIDDCRVSKITLEGLIGTKKVRATVGVIPKIVAIIAEGGSENDTNITVNLDKSKYSNGIVNMSDLTSKLKAVIVKPNGERLNKAVTVSLWNPPYIDISNSNTYYVVATINHYSTPVVIMIKIN
jgi:Putative cell wall-binding domain